MNRFVRGVIFGAPGSGKGTILKMMKEDFGFVSIATGDILRHKAATNDPKFTDVAFLVNRGMLVPDHRVVDITREAISKLDADKTSWMLDGMPRTIPQAKALEAITKIDFVINVQVPYEQILERLSERLVHLISGRTYNLRYNPPKNEGKDDLTGEPLIRRPDDNEKIVKNRLKCYEELTAPLISYFQEKGILETFKGEESKQIYRAVKPFVQRYIDLH